MTSPDQPTSSDSGDHNRTLPTPGQGTVPPSQLLHVEHHFSLAWSFRLLQVRSPKVAGSSSDLPAQGEGEGEGASPVLSTCSLQWSGAPHPPPPTRPERATFRDGLLHPSNTRELPFQPMTTLSVSLNLAGTPKPKRRSTRNVPSFLMISRRRIG